MNFVVVLVCQSGSKLGQKEHCYLSLGMLDRLWTEGNFQELIRGASGQEGGQAGAHGLYLTVHLST